MTDRRTILVVEDDPDVRGLAIEALRDAGYDVLEAENGGDAIVQFERHPEIDVIFTDIVMPGLDGFIVADMAKIRRPEVKILYATGFIHREREHLGVVHGGILRKPYRQSELIAAVAHALAACAPGDRVLPA
jgi:CheY-like chemotaxis protein